MAKEDERSTGKRPDLFSHFSQYPELKELLEAYKKAWKIPIPPNPELEGLVRSGEEEAKRKQFKELTEQDKGLIRRLEELNEFFQHVSSLRTLQNQARSNLLLTPLREMKDKVLQKIQPKHIIPYDAFLLAFLDWDENSLLGLSGGTVTGLRRLLREAVLEKAERLEKMRRYIGENQGSPIVVMTGSEDWAAGQAGSLELKFYREDRLFEKGGRQVDLVFHPLGNTSFTKFPGRRLYEINSIWLDRYTTTARGSALIGSEKPDIYDHVEVAIGESAIQQLVKLRIRDGDLGEYRGLSGNGLFGIFAALNGANIPVDWRGLLGGSSFSRFRQHYEKLPGT